MGGHEGGVVQDQHILLLAGALGLSAKSMEDTNARNEVKAESFDRVTLTTSWI